MLWFLHVQTERKGGWGSRAPILPVPCEHRPEPRDCRIPKGVPLGLRLSAAEGREGSRFLSKANSTSLEPGLGRAYVTVTTSTMSRGAGVGLTAIQPSMFGWKTVSSARPPTPTPALSHWRMTASTARCPCRRAGIKAGKGRASEGGGLQKQWTLGDRNREHTSRVLSSRLLQQVMGVRERDRLREKVQETQNSSQIEQMQRETLGEKRCRRANGSNRRENQLRRPKVKGFKVSRTHSRVEAALPRTR